MRTRVSRWLPHAAIPVASLFFCLQVAGVPSAHAQAIGNHNPAEFVDCAVPASSTPQTRLIELDGDWSLERVATVGNGLLMNENFLVMNQWLDNCFALKSRNLDGRFTAEAILPKFNLWWGFSDADTRRVATDALTGWRDATPTSAYPNLFEAIYWYAQGWAARGSGMANTVSPTAWRIFKERLGKAQALLEAIPADKRSPVWYELALALSLETGQPLASTLSIYVSGAKRYPEYHPIHFAMARAVFPQWGGSDEAVEAYAQQVRKQAGGALGDELYARIYWTFGSSTLYLGNFFEFSQVSWPTMRRGFEEMERRNPESGWMLNNFASFACRAGDSATYLRLQPKRAALPDTPDAWPDGWSREVCDEKFTNRT